MSLQKDYFEIDYPGKQGLAVLRINRPEKRNAMSRDMWHQLRRHLSRLGSEPKLRTLVITGTDKAFCSGADIAELQSKTWQESFQAEIQETITLLEGLPLITVAAINGHALGGGCELALACDFRFAAEHVKIGLPELKLGILPGGGGTVRLTRLIGVAAAKNMILRAKILSASEALQLGLVTGVVKRDDLENAWSELHQEMLALGPTALKLAKYSINIAGSRDADVALRMERIAQTLLYALPEHIEGMTAFVEGRTQQFDNF